VNLEPSTQLNKGFISSTGWDIAVNSLASAEIEYLSEWASAGIRLVAWRIK